MAVAYADALSSKKLYFVSIRPFHGSSWYFEITYRYETVVSEMNRELDDGKEALESARTRICEQDTLIAEKESALSDEKFARSSCTAEVVVLESRLKRNEERLQEREAEMTWLAGNRKLDEAQYRMELGQLQKIIEEKDAALKMEQQTRSQFSLENKRLWRELQGSKQVRFSLKM